MPFRLKYLKIQPVWFVEIVFLYLHLWYFVSSVHLEGPGWLNELGRCRARVAQWVRSLDLTAHTSLSSIRRGFAPSFANYKKGCTRLAAANDNVYQLLAQGWWFFPGSPASSTTKTGRHDVAEILLKVALNTKIHSNSFKLYWRGPSGSMS